MKEIINKALEEIELNLKNSTLTKAQEIKLLTIKQGYIEMLLNYTMFEINHNSP